MFSLCWNSRDNEETFTFLQMQRKDAHPEYSPLVPRCCICTNNRRFNYLQIITPNIISKYSFLFTHLLQMRAFLSLISRDPVYACIIFIDTCINGYTFCVFVSFFPNINRVNQLKMLFERFILTASYHWPCQLTFTGAPLHIPRFSRANTQRARGARHRSFRGSNCR